MFTIDQIEELHARVGNAETLAEYVRSLGELGVEHYDSFVFDGHSEFLGQEGHRVVSGSAHDELIIATSCDREAVLEHLRRHERGETSYLQMSRGLADSGIEKWTVDTTAMTMTFFDQSGIAVLVEEVA